uniref:Tyrosinase copper-binding domain-containing protein n=1 Tax=Tetradesmus obliquus TaxID=3088 RepID=A0A383VC36_TETOB|eukprot:jgi/Sobl393_1/17753/SZX63135.1
MNIPNPLKAVVVQEDLGDVQTSSDIFNPMSRPKYQVPSMSYPYTPKGYATVRYPDNNYESQAYDLQHNMLQSVSLKFRPRLSKMFAVGNWREFSNHTTGTASLEGVHDQVHDTLGWDEGHMGYPEVAAFDPIFFLHHANVDRLLALWQVVYDDPSNPATWIQPEEEKAGTFTFPDGTNTDENTPLTPFRKREQLEDEAGNIDQSDMGAFYTSKGVRSLEINQIYSPSLDYTEGYRLHVNFKGIAKLRLNGAFSMNVFVGYDKSDYVVDASTPTKDNPYFAGSVSVFASSNAASNKCANCRHPDRQQVCGSVDLTSALPRPKLITAETELTWGDLEGKLKDNIQWVAVKPNGAQIHHVAVKDISVTWTRPYNLTEDEQDALIGPMPSEPVQLPAPVANYVAAQNEAGPTARRSAFFAAPKTNRGPVLFVATADLSAPAGPESGGTAA